MLFSRWLVASWYVNEVVWNACWWLYYGKSHLLIKRDTSDRKLFHILIDLYNGFTEILYYSTNIDRNVQLAGIFFNFVMKEHTICSDVNKSRRSQDLAINIFSIGSGHSGTALCRLCCAASVKVWFGVFLASRVGTQSSQVGYEWSCYLRDTWSNPWWCYSHP